MDSRKNLLPPEPFELRKATQRGKSKDKIKKRKRHMPGVHLRGGTKVNNPEGGIDFIPLPKPMRGIQ